jgi:phospholipid/cholesterol/gamma-HCH transport system substrate-binding protein
MLTRTQRARLGAFMIAGLALLVIFVSIPIGFKLSNREKSYYSYFEGERSLSGLEDGADVKFRGVRIGKVSRISYNPKNISRIRVELHVREDFPVKSDMYVETGFMGITGLRYVELLGGTNEAPQLKAGSELPSRPSLMATISGKTDVIIEKIELLLDHLTEFTSPESLATVKQILKNVASITTEVDGFVKEVSPNVKKVAASTVSTMRKVDLIAADVKSVSANLNTSINAAQLGQILGRIDSTARSLNSLSQNLDLTIRQTREDFRVSLENLRQTMENANQLSKILTENPSLILRGENQKQRDIR